MGVPVPEEHPRPRAVDRELGHADLRRPGVRPGRQHPHQPVAEDRRVRGLRSDHHRGRPSGFFSPEQVRLIKKQVSDRGTGQFGSRDSSHARFMAVPSSTIFFPSGRPRPGRPTEPVVAEPTELSRRLGVLVLDPDDLAGDGPFPTTTPVGPGCSPCGSSRRIRSSRPRRPWLRL